MKKTPYKFKPITLLVLLGLVFSSCSSNDDSSSNDPEKQLVTTSVSPANSGTILPNSGSFDKNKQIDLAAIPAQGWEFKEWQGDVTGSENPMQITVDEAKNIMAIFTRKSFYLADNGITILAPNAAIGDVGVVNGITYTKRSVDQITPENAATTCTSGITNMDARFAGQENFNADISHWDVSSVTSMSGLFNTALSFNQDLNAWDVSNVTNMAAMFRETPNFKGDISNWDVSNVTNMENMFRYASAFNQDLSGWCVTNITSEPSNFALNSPLTENNKPAWGTCP